MLCFCLMLMFLWLKVQDCRKNWTDDIDQKCLRREGNSPRFDIKCLMKAHTQASSVVCVNLRWAEILPDTCKLWTFNKSPMWNFKLHQHFFRLFIAIFIFTLRFLCPAEGNITHFIARAQSFKLYFSSFSPELVSSVSVVFIAKFITF